MKDMNKISELVKELLEEREDLRNDDRALYIAICKRYNKDAMSKPFMVVWANPQFYGLPSHLTVERARRKVQELYPWLKGTNTTRKTRHAEEDKFRKYAREAEIR